MVEQKITQRKPASAACDSTMPAAARINGDKTTRKLGTTEADWHVVDQPFTLHNWRQKINWVSVPPLIVVPILGLLLAPGTTAQRQTIYWTIIYYVITGIGITAGYHRLWSHRAYSACFALRVFLMLAASGAFEGSIRWWSRDHRSHHRYTDTERDPYSVRKGFWYSHLGWMLLKQNPKMRGRCDISDLNADPLVIFQHRNYLKIAPFMALIFPMLVSGLFWGDWRGGFVYAGLLRLFFIHHATFCVNSLAHWLGVQRYDDKNSSRDHILTAFVTLGEGYHNFHHSFPNDYRNALFWYQFDPTKGFIYLCKMLGLARDLKQFPSNEIQKGLVQQKQKKLDQWRAKLDWGTPIANLPVIEYEEYTDMSKKKPLILIAGVVHDLTHFDHPGGKAFIKAYIGRDATAAFNGGVYDHSNGAHNLLSNYRMAVVRGGMEVEFWKTGANGVPDGKEVKVDGNGMPIIRSNDQLTKVKMPVEAAAAS